MKRWPTFSGFTMIEICVVTVIVALLVSVAYKLTSSINTVSGPNLTNRLILQMEGRRLADNTLEEIRKSSDIIRPLVGETTPFLLVKDAENQVCYYYLNYDKDNSSKFGRNLYELCAYLYAYEADKRALRKFGNSIESLTFTGVSPNCVQINIKIANDKAGFQFLSQAGLMCLGDLDD